ncbi:MAG: DUF3040 domain-containing protein [Actinomycetales bacterium]|nr:DUF3040 domain-containing protein [Tetrasphaera sp.]NLW99818.1 DUF3040 domain-containing protein [Actinomycetales bacterium]
MPLSDREQQLLEQMERALFEEDPRFASSLAGGPRTVRNRRRVLVGVGGALLGLGIVLLGITFGQVMTVQVIIGALGFATMVASVVYALTERKATLHVVPTPGASAGSGKGKARKSGSSSFMDKMERRWEKRRDEGRF